MKLMRSSKILNEKGNGMFNIPLLIVTQESLSKLSKVVTEYSPLIKSYNDVIKSAREVDEGKSGTEEFYKASAIFGLEFATIYWAVFYGASYSSVGYVYRAVGLNRFAFECGPCISFILSNAHWAVRTALVEESAKRVEWVFDKIENLIDSGTFDSVYKAAQSLKNQIQPVK